MATTLTVRFMTLDTIRLFTFRPSIYLGDSNGEIELLGQRSLKVSQPNTSSQPGSFEHRLTMRAVGAMRISEEDIEKLNPLFAKSAARYPKKWAEDTWAVLRSFTSCIAW